MGKGSDLVSAGGLVLGIAVIAAAHLAGGGDLRIFLQPTALLVVIGGTAASSGGPNRSRRCCRSSSRWRTRCGVRV
jgi:flagellar motor component MotA